MHQNGIVIVGGGHGGSQIAASLREEGYDGPLTLVSAELEIPYQRPPLSKAFLKEQDHDLLPLRPESFYAKHHIDLRLGTQATAIDIRAGTLSLADGTRLPFDRLAVATGSRPRMPDIEGIGLDGVFALREAEDARRLRVRLHGADRVVVVGGGFIGLEIAATARLLGKEVTVLEAADRLMGRVVHPTISEHFLALHRGWGSDVRLSTPIGRILGADGHVTGAETASGDRIEADLAIIGIGVLPNVELARDAGLAVDNGILVDDFMRTSVPEIVAIGDCVSFHQPELGRRIRLESVQNAIDQARNAALTLLDRPEPYREVPWFWSDQGDVKLQMVGLPFSATRSVVRGKPEEGIFSVFHFAGDRLVAIDSVNKAQDHMIGRRLIAAGVSPSPELCADASSDLKSLIPRAVRPAR